MIMDAGAMMLLYDDIEKAYRGEPLEQDTYCTYIAHQERERTTERYRKAKDELLRMYDDECWRVGFLRDQDTGSPETVYLPCRRVITKAEMLGLAKHLGLSDTLLCTGMILLTMARIDGEGNCLCNICYHNRSNDLTRNALGFLLTWINVAVKVRRSMSVAEFYRELQASWIASTETLCAGMDATAYSRRNTQLLMIFYQAYETVGSDALASLGAKREELQLTVHSADMDQICDFFEQPDLIAPALVFNKQHYSPEKQASIMDALENVINRLAAVEDPETATLAELLD